jgi:hypothetical protein
MTAISNASLSFLKTLRQIIRILEFCTGFIYYRELKFYFGSMSTFESYTVFKIETYPTSDTIFHEIKHI